MFITNSKDSILLFCLFFVWSIFIILAKLIGFSEKIFALQCIDFATMLFRIDMNKAFLRYFLYFGCNLSKISTYI